jgi:phage terminase large subunit GpA-like protein
MITNFNLAENWKPPEKLTINQWAEKHRVVAYGTSPISGKWDNANSPWMLEPMSVLHHIDVERVTLKMPVQVSKTESIINVLFYYIHYEPSPILFLLPKKDFAVDFVFTRFDPNINATKVIKDLISKEYSTDTKNKNLSKRFKGGYLSIVGSGSPTDLSSRPVRVVVVDELDRCQSSVKTEGSVIDLLSKRMERFYNRKMLLASSPTLKDHSPTEYEYENSRKYIMEVACPHCKEYQEFDIKQLVYTLSDKKRISAHLACKHNGCQIEEKHRRGMSETFRWVCVGNKHIKNRVGFTTNALTLPITKLNILAEEYEAAKSDNEKMQVFVNTRLAQVYAPKELGTVNHHKLSKLALPFNENVTPKKVGATKEDRFVITAGVDIQGNRIEIVVIGNSIAKTGKFVYAHKVIFGDFEEKETRISLRKELQKTYNGKKIAMMFVDANYKTEAVCEFCKLFPKTKAIVGRMNYQHGQPVIMGKTELGIKTSLGDKKYSVIKLNANKVKDFIHEKNKQAIKLNKTVIIHYSTDLKQEFYKQLTAEQLIAKAINGQKRFVWDNSKGLRNEALDCTVYAISAYEYLIL